MVAASEFQNNLVRNKKNVMFMFKGNDSLMHLYLHT